MSNQQALLDFLTYSYFKIIPEEIYRDGGETDYSGYCIKKAIMKAYEDATNEGAYNTLFKKTIGAENLDKLKDASVAARKASAQFLLSQIQKLSSFAGDYDKWHNNTCGGICEKYSKVCLEKGPHFFTYGNAQKWVNMSMKYIWMLGLLPIEVPETALHVPIDRYIIDTLWDANQDIGFPLKEGRNVNRKRSYAKPSDYVIGWSQWEKTDYCETFRKSISGDEFTLEWENNAWIRAAEKRKKADLDKQYELFWKE